MIEAGRESAEQAGAHIAFRLGRIEDFATSERFDLVTIGRALHWLDRTPALEVLDRIVSEKGWVAVLKLPSREKDVRYSFQENRCNTRLTSLDLFDVLYANLRHRDQFWRIGRQLTLQNFDQLAGGVVFTVNLWNEGEFTRGEQVEQVALLKSPPFSRGSVLKLPLALRQSSENQKLLRPQSYGLSRSECVEWHLCSMHGSRAARYVEGKARPAGQSVWRRFPSPA